MKYALIADLHGNLEALNVILAHAAAQGVGRYVFLGDIVGYGPDPEAVLEIVRDLVSRCEGYAVLGNHDAAACGRGKDQGMNRAARRAIEWTRTCLKPRHQQWLMALPLIIQQNRMVWVHASTVRPEGWTYVDHPRAARHCLREANANWVFAGHVHDPKLYYTCGDDRVLGIKPRERSSIKLNPRREWLAIVGSAGQPRDGLPGARYAIFDRALSEYTSYRLAYDFAITAAKMRSIGLPEVLARFVEGAAQVTPQSPLIP